ncbi:MAG: TonB-dependent receptor [Gemmatimonadota bacterium]|nr:TonB-dependent receptor [Gemmatimonadota bacterium]
MAVLAGLLIANTVGSGQASAQQRDSLARRDTVRLAPVVTTVTRERGRSPLDLPYAISIVRPDSSRPGQRHLGIDESLLLLPGVTVANRFNPSQDPRIALRGFGARSAFGVRGVKVLRDGIPLTLPDGQTPVDYLDLESVGSVEVIRGSASALYGNASGGVIDLRTVQPSAEPLTGELRGSGGSFDTQRLVGALGGTLGAERNPIRYFGDVARTTSDGVRAHARQRLTGAFGRVGTGFDGTDVAIEGMYFFEPLAENPGALTASQLAANPAQADPLSVRKRARKEVRQIQLGITAAHPIAREGELSAALYGGTRELLNPLTFAVVDVDRTSGGAMLMGTLPFVLFGLPHRLTAGVDLQRQHDDRHEYENCNDTIPVVVPTARCPVPGAEAGAPRKDQLELVSSVGPFARLELQPVTRLWLSAGVRADRVRFEVRDRLVTPSDPNDSGERTLSAVSPMAGVAWRVAPLASLYASVSSAFETPTATELGNKPDGSAGINPALQAQYATTYESGVKGYLRSAIQYDAAVFLTRVRDELVPFEIAGSGGRRYYRNAGRTERKGGELGLGAVVGMLASGTLRLGLSYSYSDFRFTNFTVGTTQYAGKRIPGIPVHQAQASVTWRRRDLFATVEGVASGSVPVDDPNSARAAGYEIANVRVGSTALLGARWIAPVAGAQNVFDRRYVSSVSVNATGGKFYEPGSGRLVFVGLTLRIPG